MEKMFSLINQRNQSSLEKVFNSSTLMYEGVYSSLLYYYLHTI